MRPQLFLPVVLFAAITPSLAAQNEVLYYKFEGGGTKALNYVPGSPAPGQGPITNTLTTGITTNFVPGMYGQALNGGVSTTEFNYVDTGWSPSVTGDYSWAMWVRNSAGTPGPSLTYLAGVPNGSSFRIYGGSSTLLTVGGAGGTTYYATVANVYALATAGWTHVAFVVDTTAMTATYYINGVAEAPRVLTAAPNINGTPFYIGRAASTSYPSIYDIDEFRFLQRTATLAEIATWSTTHTAGVSEFSAGCDASLASNGLPQLGNFNYGLTVGSQTPNAIGIFAIGFSRTVTGPLSLPLDLGAYLSGMSGCQWEVSPDTTQLMVLDAQGSGSLGFPVLPNAGYDQLSLYAQGLFVGGPRGTMTTNPVAFILGN